MLWFQEQCSFSVMAGYSLHQYSNRSNHHRRMVRRMTSNTCFIQRNTQCAPDQRGKRQYHGMATTQGLRQFISGKDQWRIALPVTEHITATFRTDPGQAERHFLFIAACKSNPVIDCHAIDDMDKLVN